MPDQSRSRRSRKILWASLLGSGAVLGAALTFYVTQQTDTQTISCVSLTGNGDFCRFIGGPLEVAGAPVFVDDRSQALFPTKADLTFIDAQGDHWTAPAKTLTDGASIPAVLATVMGDRQSREYLLAAALHDAFCGVGNEDLATYHTRPWEDVHRMFYEALLVNGTAPRTARIMYAAVYLGGPRWNNPTRDLTSLSDEVLRQEFEWCLRWMEKVDPDPDQIDAWMESREKALQAGTQSEPDWSALFSDKA